MNNLDTSNWKWFKISDIFQSNLKIVKYSSEPEEKGNVPFITSTSLNNGVNSFVNAKISFDKKCLAISKNRQCFDAFLLIMKNFLKEFEDYCDGSAISRSLKICVSFFIYYFMLWSGM